MEPLFCIKHKNSTYAAGYGLINRGLSPIILLAWCMCNDRLYRFCRKKIVER